MNTLDNTGQAYGVILGSGNTINLNYNFSDQAKANISKHILQKTSNDVFIGRTTTIKKLVKALDDQKFRICITGPGGQGKTALAKRVAIDALKKEKNTFKGILYADLASNNGSLNNIINNWAVILGFSAIEKVKELSNKVLMFVSELQKATPGEHKYICILDDVRIDLQNQWIEQIDLLLNAVGNNWSFIITSRNKTVAISTRSSVHLQLSKMRKGDAVALCKAYAPELTTQTATKVVTSVGTLPLAIILAASLSNIYGHKYVLEKLSDSKSAVLFLNVPNSSLRHDSILKTFSITYDSLSREGKMSFKSIQIFQGENIRIDLFQSYLSNLFSYTNEQISFIIEEFIAHNVCQFNGINLYFHALLKGYAESLISSDDDKAKYKLSLCKNLLEIIKEEKASNKFVINEIVSLLAKIGQDSNQLYLQFIFEVCKNYGILHRFGIWSEAIKSLELMYSFYIEGTDIVYYEAIVDLGIYYRETAQYEVSENVLLNASKDQKFNGKSRCKALAELAVLYAYIRDFDRCKKAGEAAVEECMRLNDHESLAQAYMALARNCDYANKNKDASIFINKSIKLYSDKKAYNRQLNSYALSLGARILSKQPNIPGAINQMYEEALSIAKSINDSQAIAYIEREKSNFNIDNGAIDLALEGLLKSKEIYEVIQDYSALAGTLCLLGHCYLEKKEYVEAVSYYTKGFERANEPKWKNLNLFGIGRSTFLLEEHTASIDKMEEAINNLNEIGYGGVPELKKIIDTLIRREV